jgi:flagellar FliJ protein
MLSSGKSRVAGEMMSPKFKFRLDSVLKHRKIIEKKESKLFAELHKKYKKEYSRLDRLLTQFKKTQNELSVKKRKGIDITELKTYHTYINSLNGDIKSQKFKVKEAEAKMEKQRKKLIAAQKNMKVIDKLRENEINNFKEEERKNDIKAIDDINVITTARNSKS